MKRINRHDRRRAQRVAAERFFREVTMPTLLREYPQPRYEVLDPRTYDSPFFARPA